MSHKYFCDVCKKKMPTNQYRLELKNLHDSNTTFGLISDKEICEDCFNKFKIEIFEER